MTPTQEQIEAAAKAIAQVPVMAHTYSMDGPDAVALAKAALTAAAQVGPNMQSQIEALNMIKAATIERCAQVADKYEEVHVARYIAAAIRALKE